MSRRLHIQSLFACLLSAAFACAQQLPYRHFSVNDGLPHSRIYGIREDSEGYLWLCTDNGFSRYDGFSFSNYFPRSLTGSNYVIDVLPLSKDRLLVNAYKGGLCIWENGRFLPVHFMSNRLDANKFLEKSILRFTNDSAHGCIWAQTSRGELLQLRLNGTGITLLRVWRQQKCHHVYMHPATGEVFAATSAGLLRFDGQDWTALPTPGVTGGAYRLQPMGTWLLVSHEKEIIAYNTTAGRIEKRFHFANPDLELKEFSYDNMRNLFWIPLAQSGIQAFRPDNTLQPVFDFLKGVDVNCVLLSHRYYIWLGGYGSGLYQCMSNGIVNYTGANGLRDHFITHISHNNDGSLNFSFLQSVYTFWPLQGRFEKLLETGVRNPYNKCVILSDGRRLFSFKTHLQSLEGGLRFKVGKEGLFYDVAEAGPNLFWVAAYGGLYHVPRNARSNEDFVRLVKGVRTYSLTSMGDTMLAATSGGLLFFDKNGRCLDTVREGLANPVLFACEVKGDTIWCVGRDGVSMVSRSGHHAWRHPRLPAAAPDALAVAVDSAGGVWLGTTTGLYLDYGGQFFLFDELDGMVSAEITALHVYDGHLYVGTAQGLSILNLRQAYERLYKDRFASSLGAKEVQVNRNRLLQVAPEMRLAAHENNLRIPLSGVDYAPPRLRLLDYSLDGGQSWTALTNHEINLPSLGYGAYEFRLRGRLRHEAAYRELAAFRIRIAAPWYRNGWFIAFAVAVLAGLSAWLAWRIIRGRHRRAQQQLAVQKQVLDLQQKAMAALLNPHFVFNAINSINYYINNHEEEKYTLLLTDLSRLIRLNLNNTYKDAVSLASELEILDLYVAFEKHRFTRQPFEFAVDYRSRHAAETILLPSMMLQPFVENAIWHGILPGGGGEVTVAVADERDDYIQILISDDGAGLAQQPPGANEPGTVRGIGLIRERIAAYNRLQAKPISFQFIHQPNGFTVQLCFPLIKAKKAV